MKKLSNWTDGEMQRMLERQKALAKIWASGKTPQERQRLLTEDLKKDQGKSD
jgi:hypothetical protein